MPADEAREFQELVVPTPDHTVLILLPDGNENILDLPAIALYITVLNKTTPLSAHVRPLSVESSPLR